MSARLRLPVPALLAALTLLALAPEAPAAHSTSGPQGGRGRPAAGRPAGGVDRAKLKEERLEKARQRQAARGKGAKAQAKGAGQAPGTEEAEEEPIVLDPEQIERRQAEHAAKMLDDFRNADLDANNWVSFREAETSMKLTKDEYRLYDTNGDGRLSPMEFRDRYQSVLEKIGGVRSPAAKSEPEPVPEPPRARESFPQPKDVLALYDRDGSGGLSHDELDRLFKDVAMELSADVMLSQMDPNESGELEVGELTSLSTLVGKLLPRELVEAEQAAQSFDGLYKSTVPRGGPEGAQPRPPRIPGPVSHFRRLDLFDDGWIDADDLRELVNPAHLTVNPRTIIAALDADGDGRLGPGEFRAALGLPRSQD